MEEKISGIVLSGISYGESDKIVSILTPEGVVSAKLKSVKKAGAKLKFASEPFCFAEFVFSNSKTIRTVIGASLIDSFYPVRMDIKKLYSASCILAYARKFCKENLDCADILIIAIDALKKMAYGDKSELLYLVEFLIKALSYSGYAIDTFGCHNCGAEVGERMYFDYNTGSFYCQNCFDGQGREILPQTFQALKYCMEYDDGQSGATAFAIVKGGVSQEHLVKALKFLEYYMLNKVDVELEPLKELLKICVDN